MHHTSHGSDSSETEDYERRLPCQRMQRSDFGVCGQVRFLMFCSSLDMTTADDLKSARHTKSTSNRRISGLDSSFNFKHSASGSHHDLE